MPIVTDKEIKRIETLIKSKDDEIRHYRDTLKRLGGREKPIKKSASVRKKDAFNRLVKVTKDLSGKDEHLVKNTLAQLFDNEHKELDSNLVNRRGKVYKCWD